MNKKDKIIFIAATAFLFLSLFVFSALFDDRILSKASFTATLTIELLLYLGYIIYLLRKHFSAGKRAKERRMLRHGATMTSTLKHIEGLPIAQGVPVEVYYGPEKVVFKKDKQEISIARSKITGIDCVTGKDIKSRQLAGAATGKYLLGGMTGAVIGSLAATTTYLVISYTSDGRDKYVMLDTAASGTFALKLQKDFKKHDTSAPSSIEL